MQKKRNGEPTYKQESVDLSDMSPLEVDEEAKYGKGLEILAPNKL